MAIRYTDCVGDHAEKFLGVAGQLKKRKELQAMSGAFGIFRQFEQGLGKRDYGSGGILVTEQFKHAEKQFFILTAFHVSRKHEQSFWNDNTRTGYRMVMPTPSYKDRS